MSLIEQIISPFIYFIEYVFLFSYNLTGNYGWAIILLSLSVSLLLLPVFIYIEKSKKKDDVIKNKMKPLIDEIKRVYKGQERYYYIKTINRQHNYSSLKALIPILSLLIQIPFFIAAYQYLEHFEGMQGVSFGFIKDLSLADGLFGIVNILPILMTLVNLITVYYYTRLGDGSERKQMLVIAIAFLVLLFNLPAGLVLYWTMNNVFSFLRLFITNPEVFKKKKGAYSFFNFISDYKKLLPQLKKIFVYILLVLVLSQISWAFKYYFDDIAFRLLAVLGLSIILTIILGSFILFYKKNINKLLNLKIKPIIYFSLLFSAIYFYLASEFYYTGLNKTLILFSFIPLFGIELIGILYSFILYNSNKNRLYKYLNIFLKLLLISQLLSIASFIINKDISFNIFSIIVKFSNISITDISVLGLIFTIFSIPFYFLNTSFTKVKIKSPNYIIYLLSVFFVLGLIFFWKPLLVYASSPDTFDFPAINILINNLKLFLISSLIAFGIYLSIPRKYKYILFFISLLFVIISFVYSLVIPINLGSLQVSQFSEQANLASLPKYYLLEVLLLISIFMGIRWIIRNAYFKVTLIVLIVFNILVVTQSLWSAMNTGVFFSKLEENNSKEITGIPFSKDQKNIVYFLADGFQGWYFDQVLKDEPQLKDIFYGFTYYPNTVSVSNYTHSSLPALFLGLEHSVSGINKDSLRTMNDKIKEASILFIEKARKKGYQYSSSSMHYSGLGPNDFDNYIPFWNEKWKKYSMDVALGKEVDAWKKRLYENALFYSVPLFLKPKIYNNTKWLEYYSIEKELKNKNASRYSLKPYNFIRLLPYISTAKKGKPNFIYIHDHSLHNPWNTVDDDGVMHSDITPYENNRWFMLRFAKWITWMKENEVYDNTKIVVISDHGVTWGIWEGNTQVNSSVNFGGNNPSGINDKKFWRLNPLLLVKDFDTKGPVRYDWRLMSNGDAPSILFDEDDQTKKDSTARTLISNFTTWEGEVLYRNRIKVHYKYEVKNNIFDLNNWKSLHVDNKKTEILTNKIKLNKQAKPDKSYHKDEVTRIIRMIKNNKKWLEAVKKQAKERNLSLDSMLIRNANYYIKQLQKQRNN